jgi:hypothetical protein
MGSTAIEKANARSRAKAFACEDASADPIGSAFAFPLPLVTLADFLAGRDHLRVKGCHVGTT